MSASRVGCDFCRGVLATNERRRLVWVTGFGSELVLAYLCGRCASRADELLERYAGHGRSTIHLVVDARPAAPADDSAFAQRDRVPASAALAFVGRSAIYILVGVAAFLFVTLLVARPW